MKFKIEEVRVVKTTNILGKPLEVSRLFYVYRRGWFFGFPRLYLSIFRPPNKPDNYYVYYYPWRRNMGTGFRTRAEAEDLIRDIGENPDKYVRDLERQWE